MREKHTWQGRRGSGHGVMLLHLGCGVLMLMLSSCSAGFPPQAGSVPTRDTSALRYSIVCIIHGDGGYVYHDTSGAELAADEEALKRIRSVAENNPQAEVFVYHQRTRRQFLWVFPLPDGAFSYYRKGRLVAQETYRSRHGASRFGPEADLYRRFRSGTSREMLRLFLYFGHEIPEHDRAGYDASSPDAMFSIHDLAGGLKELTGGDQRFDLVVLSTCYGGTPYTVGALAPFGRYIVTSPDNLHLSYFDLRALDRLNVKAGEANLLEFARRFARRAFDVLTRDVQTAVSVAVYDVDQAQDYVRSVRSMYAEALDARKEGAVGDHCDCGDLPEFVLPTMSDGVDILYRPARFGRSKKKQRHSGWECWDEKGMEAGLSKLVTPVLE